MTRLVLLVACWALPASAGLAQAPAPAAQAPFEAALDAHFARVQRVCPAERRAVERLVRARRSGEDVSLGPAAARLAQCLSRAELRSTASDRPSRAYVSVHGEPPESALPIDELRLELWRCFARRAEGVFRFQLHVSASGRVGEVRAWLAETEQPAPAPMVACVRRVTRHALYGRASQPRVITVLMGRAWVEVPERPHRQSPPRPGREDFGSRKLGGAGDDQKRHAASTSIVYGWYHGA
ncbi:MAG: hypothetical protein IT378_24090 [Sandaracinaceae bacterium]|nr:hypothetical protein [Sandaracinaceae bacterium]